MRKSLFAPLPLQLCRENGQAAPTAHHMPPVRLAFQMGLKQGAPAAYIGAAATAGDPARVTEIGSRSITASQEAHCRAAQAAAAGVKALAPLLSPFFSRAFAQYTLRLAAANVSGSPVSGSRLRISAQLQAHRESGGRGANEFFFVSLASEQPSSAARRGEHCCRRSLGNGEPRELNERYTRLIPFASARRAGACLPACLPAPIPTCCLGARALYSTQSSRTRSRIYNELGPAAVVSLTPRLSVLSLSFSFRAA